MSAITQIIQNHINDSKKIISIDNNNFEDIYDFWNFVYSHELHNNKYDQDTRIIKTAFYTFITSIKKYNPVNKFKFLKTFLSNIFHNEKSKEEFLTIFSKIQKTYHAMSRFAFLYKFKKSEIQINTDVYLNPIEPTDKNVISILQNNKKYLFTITDLINIFNTSLGNTCNFFSSPLVCKNPYNNMPFNKSTLYNIYFYMSSTTFIVPLLFHQFFMENFNLKRFKIHNEAIIRDYAIKSHLNNTNNKTMAYSIKSMLSYCHYSSDLYIDKDFPHDLLVDIMKPYYRLYLLSECSVDEYKRHHFKRIFNRKIKDFVSYNPAFGRKILITRKYNITNEISYKKNCSFNTKHISFQYSEENFINNHVREEDFSDDENSDVNSDSDDESIESLPRSNEDNNNSDSLHTLINRLIDLRRQPTTSST